jgi:hypothetical protein
VTNEDFPPASADEPIPPEDADLDARSQPIYDEPDEVDEAGGDQPDSEAGAGTSVI